jgi:hypothetical protein
MDTYICTHGGSWCAYMCRSAHLLYILILIDKGVCVRARVRCARVECDTCRIVVQRVRGVRQICSVSYVSDHSPNRCVWRSMRAWVVFRVCAGIYCVSDLEQLRMHVVMIHTQTVAC